MIYFEAGTINIDGNTLGEYFPRNVLLIAQFGTENNRFELRFDTENNIKV